MKDRLIVALDVDNIKKAKKLVDTLYPYVKIFKIGSQLFTACGPDVVKMVQKKGAQVFLDLKFHDIPNTVARSVALAAKLNVFMLNVHASGAGAMMKAAVAARGKSKKPIIIGVTVLTSMDKGSLQSVGVNRAPITQVIDLAKKTKGAGLDGVVSSAREIEAIRKACGKHFVIVTPGIRPLAGQANDQKRIATPQQAIKSGADYIVVGRPITASKDPLRAAKKILGNMVI
ncbi:orotidine-5'-phosphate decarboxylase [Candidatus Omnitrophota bacterium]